MVDEDFLSDEVNELASILAPFGTLRQREHFAAAILTNATLIYFIKRPKISPKEFEDITKSVEDVLAAMRRLDRDVARLNEVGNQMLKKTLGARYRKVRDHDVPDVLRTAKHLKEWSGRKRGRRAEEAEWIARVAAALYLKFFKKKPTTSEYYPTPFDSACNYLVGYFGARGIKVTIGKQVKRRVVRNPKMDLRRDLKIAGSLPFALVPDPLSRFK